MKRFVREPGNFLTHFIPALLTIPAAVIMVSSATNSEKFYSALIFGVAFIILFFTSSLYHSVPRTQKGIDNWRTVDFCAIYIMIAGSYTPTIVVLFEGWQQWLMLFIIWGIALAGIILKLGGKIQNPKVSLGIYIAMGWLVIFVINELLKSLPPEALYWFFAGGISYMIGTVFFYYDKPWIEDYFGCHEVWHICVFGGAASHYVYNLQYLIK